MTNALAFDQSARRFDADGRLHVDRSHISKATVNPYYGREIPNYQSLGLDPDRVYQLLRDPEELARAASTFARLPILSKHVPVTVDSPQPDLVVGAIGSDVEFVAPYLDASLCFWDAEAIAGIDTDSQRELSCAYRYVAVMEPGEYEGAAYDGRMTQIRGNHLALVEVGRAGSDVIVADSNPFNTESAMKMTKLGRALFVALKLASPKLAQDSALPALVGEAAKKSFDRKAVAPKLMALDADLTPEQLDEVLDAILGVEQDPEPQVLGAGDEDEEEKNVSAEPAKSERDDLVKALRGKLSEGLMAQVEKELVADADPTDPAPPMDVTAAMDAMEQRLRAQYRDLDVAKQAVRPIVGDVIGMDSAADVYRFALDHLKIEHKGIREVPALAALCKIAAVPAASAPAHVAMDGSAVKLFPGLARFS